jgi:hypothetical protein
MESRKQSKKRPSREELAAQAAVAQTHEVTPFWYIALSVTCTGSVSSSSPGELAARRIDETQGDCPMTAAVPQCGGLNSTLASGRRCTAAEFVDHTQSPGASPRDEAIKRRALAFVSILAALPHDMTPLMAFA